MPPSYAGTIGPNPTPATETVITEDIDPSMNTLIAEASRKIGVTPRNFRRDYLNPARPVLHLVQALYQVAAEVKVSASPDEDVAALIRHVSPRRLVLQPWWVPRAVESANRTRELWSALQQIFPALRAIDSSDFIRLEPRNELLSF